MSLSYLPLHNQEDISKEPLVQIANGNQCSVKPLRNDHGLDLSFRPPQVRNHQRASRGERGCAPNSTPPPSSISNRKRAKRQSVGTVDLSGVTAAGDASPQNLQTGYGPPKATVSCARPLSPATGPSQDFRAAATACRERHQMDTIQ